MKRERLLLVLAICFSVLPVLLLIIIPSIPQDRVQNGIDNERVTRLTVDLNLTQQGQGRIQEEVRYDFGSHTRPGLTFTLPFWQNLGGYFPYIRAPHAFVVQRETITEPITMSHVGDALLVKTGADNNLVSGTQTYRLSYTWDHLVTQMPNGEERIRFALSAASFNTPIDATEFTLHSPVSPTSLTCNVLDAQGRTAGNCPVTSTGTVSTMYSTRWLEKDQRLQIEAVYPRGTFTSVRPEGAPPLIHAWILIVLFHLIVAGAIWFFFGRDSKGRGVIIPSEELLANIKPYEAGALLAQWPTYASFIGLLLDLARRKVITFERLEAGGYLTHTVKRLPGAHVLDPVETRVLKRLFLYSTDSNDSKEEMSSASFDRHTSSARLAYNLFEELASEHLVARGWFPTNIRAVFVFSALILIGWTGALYLILSNYLQDPHLDWLFLQIPLLLPVIYILPRLTKAGALAREEVHGLARYIRVAEKARLAFSENPQEHTDEQNSLLPYAVAMGIQKDWTRYYLMGYEPLKK